MTHRPNRLSFAGLIMIAAGCGAHGQTEGAPAADEVGRAEQGLSTCITVQRGTFGAVEDSFIAASEPNNTSAGSYSSTYTGLSGGSEKRAVLKFDLGAIPAGATVESAMLSVFQTYKSDSSTVRAHRLTSPWSEGTATWTRLSGSSDPTVAGSFLAGAGFGLRQVDVTGLVTAWVEGAAPNHGLAFEEPLVTRTVFRTSETASVTDRPALRVCYSTATCSDGVLNQGETEVDCGGPSCAPCCQGTDEICDGVDEDCDGEVDEDYVPQPTSCGSGACAATGVTSCQAGTIADSCTPSCRYEWAARGIGDCGGHDVGSSGPMPPVASRCDASFVGKTAICWDGGAFRSSGSTTPWCTYKDIATAACTGGQSPGYRFECVAVSP